MTEVQQNTAKKLRRTLQGRVVSDKMDKTVVVLINRQVKNQRYGKYVVKSKKYHAHDELNQYNTGDLVEIGETRPYSKMKSWEVLSLIEANRG